MIRKQGNKWILYTKSGNRKLGTHPTKAAALRQERRIHAEKGRRRK